jgi:O-antigen ligase
MITDIGAWAWLVIPGILLLVIAIAKPEIGLVALVFVVYTNFSDILISRFGLPSIMQPLVGLLVVVILARRFIFQDETRGIVQPVFLLGIYSFLGYLSFFYASDAQLARSTMFYELKNAIVWLMIIALIRKPSDLNWAIWALLLAGIWMGSISMFQVFTGTYDKIYWGFGSVTTLTSEYRIEGPVGDANYYAQIMLVLIPLAFGRFMHEKKLIMRGLAGWALIVCVFTVLYTYSRGGFLAFLVVGFLILMRQPSRPWSSILLVVVLALLFYQFIPKQYTERVTTLLELVPGASNSTTIDSSLQGRSAASIAAWRMFTDHPIFGVGVGNYNTNYDKYARQLGLSREALSAHNLYLEVLAERGIFGFLSFFAVIYFTFRVLHKSWLSFYKNRLTDLSDMSNSLMIGFVGYLVAATFLHDAFIRYMWLLVGVAWSLPQLVRYCIGDEEQTRQLTDFRVAYHD